MVGSVKSSTRKYLILGQVYKHTRISERVFETLTMSQSYKFLHSYGNSQVIGRTSKESIGWTENFNLMMVHHHNRMSV